MIRLGKKERYTKETATEEILLAKRDKGLTFDEIAEAVGRHPVWVASAIMGQASMNAEEVQALVNLLNLDPTISEALQEIPMKGSLDEQIPVDPLLYRFHEILQVYGTTMKAVIHEKFGDGIISAVDFTMYIDKEENPAGDRVVVTLNGKFLPYKKW